MSIGPDPERSGTMDIKPEIPSRPGNVGHARAYPSTKAQALEPSRQTRSSYGPPFPLGRWSSAGSLILPEHIIVSPVLDGLGNHSEGPMGHVNYGSLLSKCCCVRYSIVPRKLLDCRILHACEWNIGEPFVPLKKAMVPATQNRGLYLELDIIRTNIYRHTPCAWVHWPWCGYLKRFAGEFDSHLTVKVFTVLCVTAIRVFIVVDHSGGWEPFKHRRLGPVRFRASSDIYDPLFRHEGIV